MKAFAGEIATLVLMLALAWLVGYQSGKESAGKDLARLQGMIEQQADQAGQTLARLAAERDEKQAKLDKQARDQEKKDADAKAEIERLAGELRDRPVRVRIVAQAGSCSGSAAGDAAARAEDRTGDTGTTDGILPAENTRRLSAALTEIETLSAAYSSCRAMLTEQGIAN